MSVLDVTIASRPTFHSELARLRLVRSTADRRSWHGRRPDGSGDPDSIANVGQRSPRRERPSRNCGPGDRPRGK